MGYIEVHIDNLIVGGMAMELEFVTIGMACEHLDMKQSTLRKWTDYLEKNNVHYVHRNEREERMYNNEDLEIFRFFNNYKKEFGMKTTLEDLARLIEHKAEQEGKFKLRKREDVPEIARKDDLTPLKMLDHEDIQTLMNSPRVQEFAQLIIGETTKNLKDDLKKEVREEVKEEMQEQMLEHKEHIESVYQRIEEKMLERDEKTVQRMNEIMESKKGIWHKLFGK